jgi:hypothetical protein
MSDGIRGAKNPKVNIGQAKNRNTNIRKASNPKVDLPKASKPPISNADLIRELERGDISKGYNQQTAMLGQDIVSQNKKREQEGYSDAQSEASSSRRGSGVSSLDRFTQQLQSLLSGGYRQPYDDLMSQLNTMTNESQSRIDTSMNDLQTFLQGQSNPFANFQAAQTQSNPQMTALLQSQGVDSTPLQQYATAVNAQEGAQANAFQNMVGTLSGLQAAQQAGAVGDAALNRANLQSALSNSRLGMGAQINQQALGQRNDLMQMLLTALSKGGRTKGKVSF